MTTPQAQMRRLRAAALAHDCPACGAKAGVRCRIVTHRPARDGYPSGTKVDVRPNPCGPRVEVAWRTLLAEDA
jgi:hypothetical protein